MDRFLQVYFQVTEIQSHSITISFLTTEFWDQEKRFDFFHLNEKMFEEYNFKMLLELLDLRKLDLGILWVFFVTNIWNICLVAEKLFMNIMHLVTVTRS
jgi:hypothetical protein